MIQIQDTFRQKACGNDYFYATMADGKHEATITVCRGDFGYIGVCVHNAANRAWRGLGKQFPTVEAALANYKTPAIRSMIEEAVRMA